MAANLVNKVSAGVAGNANPRTGEANTFSTQAPRHQGGLENTSGSHLGGVSNSRHDINRPGENLAGGYDSSNTRSSGLNAGGENLNFAGQQSRTNDLGTQNTVVGDASSYGAQSGALNDRENLSGESFTRNLGGHTSGLAGQENFVGGQQTNNLAGGHQSRTTGFAGQENFVGNDRTSNLAGQQSQTTGLNTQENLVGGSRTSGLAGQQSQTTGLDNRENMLGDTTTGSGLTSSSGAPQSRSGNVNAGSNPPVPKTSNLNTHKSISGNRDPRDAPTNSVDVGPPDAAQHPPSVFAQHLGEPKIEHDYPEDSTARRHSVSHQEKHFLG